MLALFACGIAWSEEPPDKIQGNWLGEWKGKGMGGKTVAQIYGLGSGTYQAVFTAYDSGEQDSGIFTFAIQGSSVNDEKVVFTQSIDLGLLGMFSFDATVEKGALTARYSNGSKYQGTLALKRTEMKSDTVGARALPGAIVLFDGKSLDGWRVSGDKPVEWKVVDGAIVAPVLNPPGPATSGHLVSRETFDDAQIHLEFRVPYLPDKRGEERGQSGVFLQGRYEVQIVDSFGFPRPKNAQGDFSDDDAVGAIHRQHAPKEMAAFPPGEWQAFDITFLAAKADKSAEITALLNGKLIHDRVPLKESTADAPIREPGTPAGLILQSAGYAVEFRNVSLVRLNTAAK